MGDIGLFAAGIVVPGVLAGLLVFVRRMASSQAWKDLLGISAAFVVLAAVGWLMMVGEHALG